MSVIISSGTVSISSGVTSTGLDVIQKGVLKILRGGSAADVLTSDGGSVVVSSGGRLGLCTISAGGTVSIYRDGEAGKITVDSGGVFHVLSAGHDSSSVILSRGTQYIYDDVRAVGTVVMDGGVFHVNAYGYAKAPVVSSGGELYIESNGMISDAAVSGLVVVKNGALASGTTVLDGGSINILPDGYVFIASVRSGGSISVSNNGLIKSASIYDGGIIAVEKSGSCNNAIISGGRVTIESGALAKNTTVCSGGTMDLFPGGSANSATIFSGGRMTVFSGGTATGIKESGGWVEVEDGADVSFVANTFGAVTLDNTSATVHSGTTASDVEAGAGGCLAIFSGGTATGIRENGGWVEVEDGAKVTFAANTVSGLSLGEGQRATLHSGTTFENVTATSGGTMRVYDGGTLTGTMTFEDNADVFVGEGGTVAFDLTQTSAGAEALLNDFSLLQGTPLYTLTVETDLNDGIYRYALAGGAAAFDGVISVYREDGEDVGTLSVGETLFIGDTSYLLGILDAVLTLTVVVPDLTLPVVSDVQASTMVPTNQDVTVTAVFSDNVALAASLYRIGDGEWLEYKEPGVTVTDNATVFFKAVDTSGNESEIVSFAVTNIDKVAPVITLDGDDLTPAREVPLTAATEAGLDIFYSVDDGTWTKYDGVITVRANGSYSFRATDAAHNTGTAEIVFANILPVAPENPAATKDRVSWDPNGAPKYVVEFSTDDFNHAFRAVTVNAAADLLGMPAGTYQWRVRADDRDVWADGNDILSDGGSAGPEVLESNSDGFDDIFFAETAGTWGEWGFFSLAQHVGSVNDWNGTNELVFLDGRGCIQNLFFGSSDPNILCLTDGENGEALFLDDVFTVLPEEIEEHQARIANIDEIRAGAGDDLIDLTSQRFEYTGGGMTVRGGAGDDVIWANKGDNSLFGDAGNDRIVGASGNDIIAGGIGNDRMHGGGGDDVFTFCDNWGSDNVEQLAGGSVTLWFTSGSEGNWNAETLTYTDGANSVKVSGVAADKITLKFGDDGSDQFATLSGMGAFFDATSERIFEEAGKGMLASM